MTRRPRYRLALSVGLITCLTMAACGGGGNREGTYESGMYQLVIQGGGKAAFNIEGQTFNCTYTENDNSLTLNCEARSPATITFNDDGSLVDPEIGTMKKVS